MNTENHNSSFTRKQNQLYTQKKDYCEKYFIFTKMNNENKKHK